MEGLAYLTLDADVKDDFVQDIPALQAMFELAKARVVQISKLRKGCQFAVPGAQAGLSWLWTHPGSALPGEAGLVLLLDDPHLV